MTVVYDLLALAIVVLGLATFCLEIVTAILSRENKWVFVFKAVGALIMTVAFSLALLSSFMGNDGGVPKEFGRPGVLVLMGAMFTSALLQIRSILSIKRGS